MAGLVASARLAAKGYKVCCIRKGLGATAMSCGSIDFCKPVSLPEGSLADDMINEISSNKSSIYRRLLARELLDDHKALSAFLEKMVDEMESMFDACGLRMKRDAYLLNRFGFIEFARLAHASLAVPKIKGNDKRLLVIASFAGLDDWNKQFALRLDEGNSSVDHNPLADLEIRAIQIDPGLHTGSRGATPMQYARFLETKDGISGLLRSLKDGRVEKGCLLALPNCIGIQDTARLLDEIDSKLGVRSFEMLDPISPLAGYKLQAALERCATLNGVAIKDGWVKDKSFSADGRLSSITVFGGEQRFTIGADHFLLATGSFVASNLEFNSQCRERIFGLRLVDSAGNLLKPYIEQATERFFNRSQPIFQGGIAVNSRLQPVDEHGVIVAENLFACGGTLAGMDHLSRRIGLGATYLSAIRAASMIADHGSKEE